MNKKCFQLSFYKEGIKQNYQDLLDQEYKIQCRWMVIPMNTENFKPWIVPCTDIMLRFRKEGYKKQSSIYYSDIDLDEDNRRVILTKGIKEYNGWRYAIQKYKRVKSENLIDYDLEWFDYQGKLPENLVNQYYFN